MHLNSPLHKFHIPVMGLGFSIDTPIKVAHLGIDSAISIVDDDLIEKMRMIHSRNEELPYTKISLREEDYRAKRITAYLNLVDQIVQNNFQKLKSSFGKEGGEFTKFIDLLPNDSELKTLYNNAKLNGTLSDIKEELFLKLKPGSIDVNIMSKVDKANFKKKEKLPVMFNDAHSSLRGFANSSLHSGVILSAGMNTRLYSYLEEFDDFYPNEEGQLNKKIILKVSDFRSALIQGKFLAKKGLWVSEYRIESGLNCGGHAFATDGFLMGPILEEFKINRNELVDSMHEIYSDALKRRNMEVYSDPFPQKFTAQGGVGNFEEQKFLIDHYGVDSVGWGTPFLLVPEVTNVDDETMKLLINSNEDDLYLSKISPLGVPFNSIRGSSKDIQKYNNAMMGKPGSNCPKKYLQSNIEFSEIPICTASGKYQSKKINNLGEQNFNDADYNKEYDNIIEKACLCLGLAVSALKNNNALTKADGEGVLICPGPNLAYFSSIVSLKEMIDHIYGRINLIKRSDRPNMFIKELRLYIKYLHEKMLELKGSFSLDKKVFPLSYINNLLDGIEYYQKLFSSLSSMIDETKTLILNELHESKQFLQQMISEIESPFPTARTAAS